MKLSLGFSPCPNDTFIFHPMISGAVDTEGLSFDVVMGDVEELNDKAFAHELDITKLSYHAFAYLVNEYSLLDSGSALGNNCGPMLIKKAGQAINPEVDKIAIPGKYTTANFLLSLAYPNATNKEEMLFSDIEGAVLNENVGAGLIIHENRFTYQDRGLEKIVDLGEFWETEFNCPIPLGGIVVSRTLDQEIQEKVNRVMRRSVEYAFAHPEEGTAFIKEHAQEMEESVMRQHIELYVNDFTVDLGPSGKKAIDSMFNKAVELSLIPEIEKNIYVL